MVVETALSCTVEVVIGEGNLFVQLLPAIVTNLLEYGEQLACWGRLLACSKECAYLYGFGFELRRRLTWRRVVCDAIGIVALGASVWPAANIYEKPVWQGYAAVLCSSAGRSTSARLRQHWARVAAAYVRGGAGACDTRHAARLRA